MPFYTWLRPRSRDSDTTLKTKQRAAQKIKALRFVEFQNRGSGCHNFRQRSDIVDRIVGRGTPSGVQLCMTGGAVKYDTVSRTHQGHRPGPADDGHLGWP